MSTPVRVLILEDRPSDAELMLHELCQAGFEPDWQCVEIEAEYAALLQRVLQSDESVDIILADCSLPQFNALEALQILQRQELDIP